MSSKLLETQPRVGEALARAIEEDRLPHALLFGGPPRSGQREAAVELARAVFCRDRQGASPCGVCVSCRKVERGTHPDLYFVEPEEDSRVIKTEEIRSLKARAALKPFEADTKIFVIDPAECLNDVGQNALLKTLEEPEGRTIFILISSSPERLLPTIHSRTRRLNFSPAAPAPAEDPRIQELRGRVLDRLLALASARQAAETDFAGPDREALIRVMDSLILFFRDALVLRAGAPGALGLPEDQFEKERLAGLMDEESLCRRIELLSEAKEWLSENVNVKLAMNVLWDRWKNIT
ncbi:MAG: DNA polymerase III subunit delta' [Candidatus Omnitrophica bacterium]|nr:DNA polymerase III subunit delta' [Candidatus Omnitrophota bacterium]